MRHQLSVFLVVSILCLAFACRANGAEPVTLYTENLRPYIYQNKDGRIAGTSVAKVRKIMVEAGLDYTIRVLPWPRAFREANINKNSLIFNLSRTQSREKMFHWVALLSVPEFYLFGHKDEKRPVTFEAIRNGVFTAVCTQNDTSCAVMLKAGFPPDKLLKSGAVGTEEKMVKRRRVDFYLAEIHRNKYRLRKLGLDPTITKPMIRVGTNVKFYLAAGLQVDQRLRDAVRAASMRLAARGELIQQTPPTAEE
ncbi:MAG: transporter substrate-binding domain-containing protein [Kordiimonadaceae bacterium]|nr:transporter substrate-binding domain-containing protein [Kordiimonadaceae bacterium]